jgi:hypothetical protein
MISLYKILKEVISPTQEYQKEVEKIKAAGGTPLGDPGNYGAAFLVGDKAVKVTTESEELEDAQAIEGLNTKYFVKIHKVQVIEPNLGIITMDRLYPYQGSEQEIPIDEIWEEADSLGISPDLEGSQHSIRVSNIMQTEPSIEPGEYLERDSSGNITKSKIKVIDV